MSHAVRILAGAMSGTSADGVDVALVEVRGRGLEMTARLLHHRAHPYDGPLKQRIFAARGAGQIALAELATLGRDISLAYAAAMNDALRAANLSAADLTAVAAHGQTLFHDPPNTIQWLDPALVAAEVGCAVVSDFRRADCAAGGQGAPLVPFADYLLFRHPTKNRVLLNLGGIGNLTWLPAGCGIESVTAWDTGPGNCISDWICRAHEPDGPGWDVGGERASRGRVMSDVADACVADAYFTQPPPKSTDGPAMISIFERALAGRHATVDDLLATAAYVTAATVARAMPLKRGVEIIASGGGTKNAAIMGGLRAELGEGCTFASPDQQGIPSDAKEALAFALLGAATIDNEPSNVPSVTGARRPVVLGSITPKPC